MTEDFSCPAGLLSHAVDDRHMAEAYEALGAKPRATLKKCIARLHRFWGESPKRSLLLRTPAEGFCVEREDVPADFALIVCAADYSHPTAFLAAIMPAVLAGVPAVLPLFIHRETPGNDASPQSDTLPCFPLLAALELAGVERAFALDEAAALAALRELQTDRGRLLFIGERPFGDSLALYAHQSGMLFRSLLQPPRYHSERLGRIAKPVFVTEDSFGAAAEGCSAASGEPSLLLGPDQEDLWFWPDLEPAWFRLYRARLSNGARAL